MGVIVSMEEGVGYKAKDSKFVFVFYICGENIYVRARKVTLFHLMSDFQLKSANEIIQLT